MEDRRLNEKESLDLIAEMIRNTQNKLEANSGKPFLIWGYVSIAIALVIWYGIEVTGCAEWSYLWFLIPLVSWPWVMRIRKRKGGVNTYIDRILNYLWRIWGTGILLACGMTLVFPDLQSLFMSALLIGMGVALSGFILRYKAIAVTGCAGMALSPLTLSVQGSQQILMLAGLFLILFVIPGHLLNSKSKKRAVCLEN
jgi:hypothetical protein